MSKDLKGNCSFWQGEDSACRPKTRSHRKRKPRAFYFFRDFYLPNFLWIQRIGKKLPSLFRDPTIA